MRPKISSGSIEDPKTADSIESAILARGLLDTNTLLKIGETFSTTETMEAKLIL